MLEEQFNVPQKEKVILVCNQDDDFAMVATKMRELIGNGMIVTPLMRSKKLGKQMDSLIALGYKKACYLDSGAFKDLG